MRKYSVYFEDGDNEDLEADGVEIGSSADAVFFKVDGDGIRRLTVAFNSNSWFIIRSHSEVLS